MIEPAFDFRIGYLEEARSCLRASNKITEKCPQDWHQQPEFWANLLGAVANSNVAAADEEVALGLLYQQQAKARKMTAVRAMLDEKLGK